MGNDRKCPKIAKNQELQRNIGLLMNSTSHFLFLVKNYQHRVHYKSVCDMGSENLDGKLKVEKRKKKGQI